jgi:murein DD-endopeptidase MepM/ murein hydrolase activator NlpD
MKKKILKFSFLTLILTGLLVAAPFVSSQYGSLDEEINDLNLRIQNQKKQIENLQTRQAEYQKQIKVKQGERANLSNQLSILENRLAKAQLDIEGANLEIDKTSLEIKKIEVDSANLDQEIEKQKQHIGNLLKIVYKQDQVSTLEMLLLNDSLTDFLNQVRYLEDTNEEIFASVETLKSDREHLESNKLSLTAKNDELAALKVKLEEKKNGLQYEQASKTFILEETRSSEKEYQSLLAQAKKEQAQAVAEINSAERSIRQKMSQKEKNILNSGNNTIDWPVTKNYVAAIFHDPDYPYRNIIGEHSGIDIRAAQGSTIVAAADGYVAKVKFEGNSNYAYIMLIHGNDLATVYGHVSAVYVSQDQYVKQGQAIGRTGGTPGSVGSGRFCTGPHLHFEVRKDGLPANPQSYLP